MHDNGKQPALIQSIDQEVHTPELVSLNNVFDPCQAISALQKGTAGTFTTRNCISLLSSEHWASKEL